MPKLRRVACSAKMCIYCETMNGVVCVEGQEPPPYPFSDFGLPAHKKCLCYYVRMNCLITQSTAGFLLAEDGTSLILDFENVPVIWIPPPPDRPDYTPTPPGPTGPKPPKKKNYRPPYPFGV